MLFCVVVCVSAPNWLIIVLSLHYHSHPRLVLWLSFLVLSSPVIVVSCLGCSVFVLWLFFYGLVLCVCVLSGGGLVLWLSCHVLWLSCLVVVLSCGWLVLFGLVLSCLRFFVWFFVSCDCFVFCLFCSHALCCFVSLFLSRFGLSCLGLCCVNCLVTSCLIVYYLVLFWIVLYCRLLIAA
jgi:hypothetical protein